MGDTTLETAELRERDSKLLKDAKAIEKNTKTYSIHIKGCIISCKNKDRLDKYKELLTNNKVTIR